MKKLGILTAFALVAAISSGCGICEPLGRFEAWKNQTLFGWPSPYQNCCDPCGASYGGYGGGCCDGCSSGAGCSDGCTSGCSDGCSNCQSGIGAVQPDIIQGAPYSAPSTSPGPGTFQTTPGPENYAPSL